MLDLSIITRELLMGTQAVTVEDLDTLRNLGVEGLLSLQDDEDLRRTGVRWELMQRSGAERGIDMRRVPIRDFDPGDLISQVDRCVAELDDLLGESPRVYVHCTAGVVLAYLVLRKKLSVDAAFRLVKSRRPMASPYRNLIDHLQTRQNPQQFG